MKVLNELSVKDLKLNKKRSIVIIIGIILSTALIFAAGSGGFFCAQPRSAGGVGSGKPRVVKGFGDGIAGSCGEPCADGPGLR